ncbi:BspA family leucine-rich repeat surface protein [Campylobacter taeniopygiae]|uniref:BspA family leucine-rich repeat surface protein n=1 Tax=Campylobacter taeniopygiae TaxID=2510188 RepID=UPI003D6AA98E
MNVYLGDIDTSKIKSFKDLFRGNKRKDFSGIETWDVSNVTNMREMFGDSYSYGELELNVDLSSWDVSKVTDMSGMFQSCKNFKGIETWGVSKVTNMSRMFDGCKEFNADISNWDVHNVKKIKNMFEGCESLKKRS